MTRAISAADTNISQVTPLLGTTPCETSQLQNTNTQEDIEEILGMTAFQRYVETPIQTLDGIMLLYPKFPRCLLEYLCFVVGKSHEALSPVVV